MIQFLRLKHTSITQAVTVILAAVVALGKATGWYHLPDTIVAGWGTVAAILWGLIGAQTVTSNARLVGAGRAGMSGVTVADVAQANGLIQAHDVPPLSGTEIPVLPDADPTPAEVDAAKAALGSV